MVWLNIFGIIWFLSLIIILLIIGFIALKIWIESFNKRR